MRLTSEYFLPNKLWTIPTPSRTLMRIAERVEYRIAQRRKHHLLYRAMIFGGSRDAVMALREELEGARQSFKV
jgi:hypothetical protein